MKALRGISIVEMMIGITLGLILCIAIISVYIAQKNIYKTNVSQAAIQNAESAIAKLVTPTIRAAGFCGCTSVLKALSNLNAGGSPPLGTMNTNPSILIGYSSTLGSPMTITQNNAPNSNVATNWSPSLDSTLTGNVQNTSDVLVVLGPIAGSQPITVTAATSGDSLTLQNASGITSGQFGAISDCSKASIFAITGVTGTTITHTAGGGALANASSAFSVNYQPGSQFIPLTQTAFFVANDLMGQSSLMRGTLNAGGTWTIQSLIPGVDTMKVLYGVGNDGVPTQYVSANAVTNWNLVYSIRIGFLLQGQQGSEFSAPTQYNVIGTTVNVPADGRLRHSFEITIHLRNSLS